MYTSGSRASFLAGLAAIGTSLGTAASPGVAQTARRIDVHTHCGSPAWLAAIAANSGLASAQAASLKDWPASRMIEEMDRAQTQVAMLSLTAPGLWFGDPAQTRRLARDANEFAARRVADHPNRFGFFAALPLPDVEGSLQEAVYCLDTLKADGVEVFTSYGKTYLGDPAFDPVFEELNRRRALVFVHPTTAQCCLNLVPDIPNTVVEGQTDTTRAIAGIVFSGASRRFSGLRLIFSHAGGTMPAVNERLVLLAQTPRYQTLLPDGFVAEAAKFYYDTATTSNAAAMSAIRKLVPPTHLVFGTDFPLRGIADQTQALEASGVFSATELDGIERGNAARMLAPIRTRA